MAQFVVNSNRFDPYKSYMFRVRWDGEYIAGLSKMSALKRTTEPVKHRVGGDPSHERKSPGTSTFDAVTFERGVTHDPAFEEWANLIHSLDSPVSLANFRKDVIVDVFNEANQLALSYQLFRCWVSEFQALPELDANANAVAIQTLKIEIEGFKRDISVVEPTEV